MDQTDQTVTAVSNLEQKYMELAELEDVLPAEQAVVVTFPFWLQ